MAGVLNAGAELRVCGWGGGWASETCQVKPRHLDPRGSGTVLPDAALRDLTTKGAQCAVSAQRVGLPSSLCLVSLQNVGCVSSVSPLLPKVPS